MGILVFSAAVVAFAAVFFVPLYTGAETLDDLKRSIEAKNQEISRLEQEAKKFREEIAERQEQAKTLSGELARIDRVIVQLRREISVTEQKIGKQELEIKALGFEISEKERAITTIQEGLGAVLRIVVEQDQESLFATLIKHRRLSDFLREFDQAAVLQERMLVSIDTLRNLRRELNDKKSEAEDKKAELEELKITLRDRNTIQQGEKRARNELLTSTKNQEKQYQALLRERETRRIALSEEIREIEAKIRVTIDSSILPSQGRGVLGYPLPKTILATCTKNNKADPDTNCLTQYFGYTSFAAVGGYSGKGHNGIDFRAEIGTPVFTGENGVVVGTGDTDVSCRRASYGKWILIRHPNNLTTLYAHLSGIGVSQGQRVARGERIGYSGASGYATGPHLHLSVFATQAIRIESIRSRVCGTTMTVPISAINGYLNPLDYL